MALRRANCWINLISICEIQADSQIRQKRPPQSFRAVYVIPYQQHRMGSEDRHCQPVLSHPHAMFGSILCLRGSSAFICVIWPGFLHTCWQGVAMKSFTGTQVLSPQLHRTRKEGAERLSTSLSSWGRSWCEHTRLACGLSQRNKWLRFRILLACLQKGNFEHNREFQQNIVLAVSPTAINSQISSSKTYPYK